MSDSIIIETPDISIDEPLASTRTSWNFQEVVDSSLRVSDASVAESVIHGTKKKAMVIRSTSSDDSANASHVSEMETSIPNPEIESMHMSVDKSLLQQSYRDMSIAASFSRSPSPENIIAISSDEEDDNIFGTPDGAQHNKHQQIKLRQSILSPLLAPPGNLSKVYAATNIQHSTPIKQKQEKQIENKKVTFETTGAQHQQHEENKGNINVKIEACAPPAIVPLVPHFKEKNDEVAKPRIEVSQGQYLQQKEILQRLHFDIIRARNMIHSVDLDKLPDKGNALKNKLICLKKEQKDGEVLLENMVVVAGSKPLKPVAWENLETGLTHVQPHTFGRKAMQTLNIQKSLTLDTLKELHGSLNTCPDANTYAENPKGLKIQLMPHQKHALAWLTWREQQKPSGGILADDMGLGKTLTMISLILNSNNDCDENTEPDDRKIHSKYTGGTLVICPATLIYQWEAEIKKYVKNGLLSVYLHHGNNREERTKRLAKQDIVITTYSLAMRDQPKNGPLFGIRWRRIIIDEAHQIRNHKSQTSVAVCALFGKSRWALTGTPVHNKELDLYALLKFLKCAPFDDLVVWKRWVANKSTGGQDRLNTVLSSLILRRTKQQLAESKLLNCLPTKEWQVVDISLDKDETAVYQKVLIFSRTLFAQFLHQKAENRAEYGTELQKINAFNMEYSKMHQKLLKLNRVKPIQQHEILVLLLRLRQICCHPSLISSMLLGEENAGDIEDEEHEEINILDQLNNMTIHEEEPLENVADGLSESDNKVGLAEAARNILNPSHPVFDEHRKSSKIKKILTILKNILSSSEKVIIISQWTKLLHLIGIHLKEESVQYYQLDGSVPVSKRMEIVDNFNNSHHRSKVLLLSLTAGGVGLNLVGANNLMLVDLHWNPQLEVQAQDRIYRVGQTKPVKIYKLISCDTIEQRIKQLQDKKLQLSEELLTGTKIQNHNKLTLDDLKMLFSV